MHEYYSNTAKYGLWRPAQHIVGHFREDTATAKLQKYAIMMLFIYWSLVKATGMKKRRPQQAADNATEKNTATAT